MNEEVDSHEFTQRFIAELRRAADALTAEREALAADRKAVAGKIANLLRLAEKTPDSASVAARLHELEEQQRELDEQIANAEQAAATRRALRATTRAEARDMLSMWMEDGQTVEEQRAAMAQLVERIEFDPATGERRMHYRIGTNGTRFHVASAAADLGLSKPGTSGVPTGIRTPVTSGDRKNQMGVASKEGTSPVSATTVTDLSRAAPSFTSASTR
jgi:ABC-type transporter Mla subunit MlaD